MAVRGHRHAAEDPSLTCASKEMMAGPGNDLEQGVDGADNETRGRIEPLRTSAGGCDHQARSGVSQGIVDAALARWDFDDPGYPFTAFQVPTAPTDEKR